MSENAVNDYYIYYMAELVRNRKENSVWFSLRSVFCKTDCHEFIST